MADFRQRFKAVIHLQSDMLYFFTGVTRPLPLAVYQIIERQDTPGKNMCFTRWSIFGFWAVFCPEHVDFQTSGKKKHSK